MPRIISPWARKKITIHSHQVNHSPIINQWLMDPDCLYMFIDLSSLVDSSTNHQLTANQPPLMSDGYY